MSDFLSSMFEKCVVSIEVTADRWHLSGRGALGVLAVTILVLAVVQFTPQLVSTLTLR